MKRRLLATLLITAFLLMHSLMGGLKSAVPFLQTDKKEATAIHSNQLPNKDPETIQTTLATGLHLLLTKKTGHTGWADPDKVSTARIESFTIHGARLPDWLKQYLQHNYPSHNFW